MTIRFGRILAAGALALAALSATTPAAEARDGISPGGAAALGVLGGLAVGGAIGSSQNNGYYPGQPVYRAPRPVYVEEEAPYCHFERRRVVDPYGEVYFRRVRVCE